MIVRVDPEDFEKSNVVQVDSNAGDNMAAIREIDDWAAEKGFSRTSEYSLRRIKSRDKGLVFRGICFRMTEDERKTLEDENVAVEERMGRLPRTQHVA
jgi:hypothetical protein